MTEKGQDLRQQLPAGLREPVELLTAALGGRGGRPFAVGGAVRDLLRGESPGELDVEVFGLAADACEAALREKFKLDLVGRQFGVFKLRGLPIDVSLPRREEVVAGGGHRDFAVAVDASLSMRAAAMRRDFTINAIYLDLQDGSVVDPLGGRQDLQDGILRHCSEKFAEDPLRPLRAAQFLSRFPLRIAPETGNLCAAMTQEKLPMERIFGEWEKLLLRGTRPSQGLRFLRQIGWLRFYPELAALIDCPQDPHWHPEGDVWEHTLHCVDAFASRRLGDRWEDLVVGLAVLCHDFGKPATTAFEDGRWRSRGHEEAGEAPARQFMGRLTREKKLIEAVVPLVVEHLKPRALFLAGSGPQAVRRLALRVGRIDRLLRVVAADLAGRPPLPPGDGEEARWLHEQAQKLALASSKPKPIVQGRHLLQAGWESGPAMGRALRDLFDAQIEGQFSTVEEGLAWLAKTSAGQPAAVGRRRRQKGC